MSFPSIGEEETDELAFAEFWFLVSGLNLHEQGFVSIFDHVLCAGGEQLLAHLSPLAAVTEDELEDGLVLVPVPLSAIFIWSILYFRKVEMIKPLLPALFAATVVFLPGFLVEPA